MPKAVKIQINVLKRVNCGQPRSFVLKTNIFDGIAKAKKQDIAKIIFRRSYPVFKKSLVFGVIALTVLSQASLFVAFESHIVNVTAKIENRYCVDFEARTIGYWKNHPEDFAPFLPVNLGDEIISATDQALDVLNNHSASEAANALKAQLLAAKFNISAFNIGDYFVESAGKTVSGIVGEADDLLRDPETTRDEFLAMKDLLDYINNLQPETGCNIVINKIYYDTAPDRGLEGDNEWIELYNKTEEPVDVSGWTICDNTSCDVLPASAGIPAKGFAVITGATTTWDYWHIPDGMVKIVLADGKIGNGLNNDADMLGLTNSGGVVMDRMNYGIPDLGWNHYNALNLWNPGAVDVAEGNTLARKPTGYDTNQPSDFVELGPPTVDLIYPDEAGSYTWYWTYDYDIKWTAINPNGDNGDVKINLYWIKDDDGSGTITGADPVYTIVEGTENDGLYNWTVPSGFLGYIWIKIVAEGPENPMLNDVSISGRIWDPPTPELIAFWQSRGADASSFDPPKENENETEEIDEAEETDEIEEIIAEETEVEDSEDNEEAGGANNNEEANEETPNETADSVSGENVAEKIDEAKTGEEINEAGENGAEEAAENEPENEFAEDEKNEELKAEESPASPMSEEINEIKETDETEEIETVGAAEEIIEEDEEDAVEEPREVVVENKDEAISSEESFSEESEGDDGGEE